VQTFIKTSGFIKAKAHIIALEIVFNVLCTFRSLLEVLCEIKLPCEYRMNSIGIEPFDTLSILPETSFGIASRYLVIAKTVLFAAKPHPHIETVICPSVNAVTMFLIIAILAFVTTSILPSINTHALHVVIQPFTLILATIQPCVSTDASDLILKPVSVVS